MNDKISLPALINLIALRTGFSRKESEDFLKAFFKEISATLEAGESVKLKDVGIFKVVDVDARKSVNVSNGEDHEIPAHRKVVFVPSKELAALINEPFSMFETVELDDDDVVDDERVVDESSEVEEIPDAEKCAGVGEKQDAEGGEEVEVDSCIEECNESADNLKETEEDTGLEEVSGLVDAAGFDEDANVYTYPDGLDQKCPGESAVREPLITGEESDVNVETDSVDSKEGVVEHPVVIKSRFGIGFLCGALVMASLAVVAFVVLNMIHYGNMKTSAGTDSEGTQDMAAAMDSVDTVAASETVSEADSVKLHGFSVSEAGQADAVPTQPSDIDPDKAKSSAERGVVYDTITKTRYLTTMAKDHYGNYNLWPYIYEENKAILGHPDRIKPGTRVMVPDLKKYGVNPNNPDDIAKAKRKGVAIYSRYK